MRYIVHTDGSGIIGEHETIQIGVDTEGELINLFEVKARLPEKVRFLGWNKENSAVNIWIKEPVYDIQNQTVQFVGGVPGGLRGRAILATLEVEPRRAGTLEFTVDSASKGFLNDGLGTEAQVSIVPTNLQILPGQTNAAWWGGGVIAVLMICAILWKLLRRKTKISA